MSLMEIPFDQVDEAALQRLVDSKVRESLVIDYKLTLPGKSDKDKREFLKDVTAFANVDGGDLLFGVRDEDGVAAEVVGVNPGSMDTEMLRLSSLVRDAIDPRIHGLNIRAIPLSDGGHVVHVRVPRSLDAPHMVQLGNYRQFWMRGPSGKYPMSTAEVRNAVMRTENWKERADQWRRSRVELVEGGEAPVQLRPDGALHVHLVPMPTGGPPTNLADQTVQRELLKVRPRFATGWNHRMTYDGFLVARELPGSGKENHWYCLWFHDGSVEYVFGDLVRRGTEEPYGRMAGLDVEASIEAAVSGVLGVQVPGVVSAPFIVFVSLSGVGQTTLPLGPEYRWDGADTPIDLDVLLIPGLFAEKTPDDLLPFLAPAINRIWQAAGFSKSPFLTDEGRRIDDRR